MPSVKSQLRSLKHNKVKFIEGNDKVRTEKCLAEINGILDQYDCIMIPEFLFSGTNLSNRIKILPKSRNTVPETSSIVPPR